MISVPTGVRIWLAAGFTDLRKGFDGLAALVQTALNDNPFSGRFTCSGGVEVTASSCFGTVRTGFACSRSGFAKASSVGPRRRAARCA